KFALLIVLADVHDVDHESLLLLRLLTESPLHRCVLIIATFRDPPPLMLLPSMALSPDIQRSTSAVDLLGLHPSETRAPGAPSTRPSVKLWITAFSTRTRRTPSVLCIRCCARCSTTL